MGSVVPPTLPQAQVQAHTVTQGAAAVSPPLQGARREGQTADGGALHGGRLDDPAGQGGPVPEAVPL